ncbi:MAG: helix-turn-helix transcriptional regulator [Patescibacteria group bacterium]|nr:helix-turn-helix transcriptional regulator [Patescibacteria group bacterium]
MLEVLGTERHRRMLAHLQKSGAMSVSKFAKPFGIGLPAAMRYVHMFERVGLIRTHKRGRIRFCVYAPEALKDLAAYLRSPSALQRR